MNMPKNGRVKTSLKANKKARKVYHKCIPPGDLTGLFKWGDGKLEEYADGSSHTYTTDPPYTVVVGMNGAEEVTLHDLSGVEEVDFSKF